LHSSRCRHRRHSHEDLFTVANAGRAIGYKQSERTGWVRADRAARSHRDNRRHSRANVTRCSEKTRSDGQRPRDEQLASVGSACGSFARSAMHVCAITWLGRSSHSPKSRGTVCGALGVNLIESRCDIHDSANACQFAFVERHFQHHDAGGQNWGPKPAKP